MNFETIIDDYGSIDVIETPKEFLSGNVKIKWSAEMETRSWGIKSISAYATKVKADLTFLEGDEEQEITIESDKDGWKLESEIEFEDDSVTTNNANFNFKDKIITIS